MIDAALNPVARYLHRMRTALLLLLAACATTRSAEPLPCTDADAPRCLQFLELVEQASWKGSQDDDSISQVLERYCLRGSTKSCQVLATRRRDNSLAQLCRDGATEACAIPDQQRSQAALLSECERARPGACRAWLRTAPERERVTLKALESACDEGIAFTCFVLAQRLPPADAERIRTLTWRSCLAGVKEACSASDTAGERCRKGEAPACEALDFGPSDDPALHAKKRGVLEDACRAGVVRSCQRLRGELGDQAVLSLACRHEEACEALATTISMKDLGLACSGAPGITRDAACATLVRVGRDEALTDIVRPAETWAREQCAASRGEKRNCGPLEMWLRARDYRLAVMRLRCETGPCDEKESLAQVDRCLGGTLEDCPRAAVWMQQHGLLVDELAADEIPLVQRVVERACDAKEAMFCVRAADLRSATVQQSLAFLERACALGSKEGCVQTKAMTAEKRACDAGVQCRAWVERMKEGERPTRVALLERSCRKSGGRECEALWGSMTHSEALRKCVESEPLCAVNKKARPRLIKLVAACDDGVGASCGELIDALFDGSIDQLSSALWSQPEPDLLKWSNVGCDAGGRKSCELVAQLTDGEPAMRALDKACEARSAEACLTLSRLAWDETTSRKDKLAPALVRARERALRACELGNQKGCWLAADFLESGIGGAADALEAERLRQR